MAYDEKLAQRIAAALLDQKVNFEEKKMFGGVAFMIREKMCCGIVKEDLMVRVLDDRYEDILSKPGAGEMNFTGRVMKGFVIVNPEGFNTSKKLQFWIDEALAFGRKGVVKSKKKSTRKK